MTGDPLSPETRVHTDGLWFDAPPDASLDVLFGDHRVWSLNALRDGRRRRGEWLVPWPEALRPLLAGKGRVTVREHLSERVLFDDEVSFGGGGGLRIADSSGRPLAVAKNGKLSVMFADAAGSEVGVLADEVVRLLEFLNDEAGVPTFLAYGSLLGAVRDGHVIGHDDDADVAFLSPHGHPAETVRESFRLERLARRAGWTTQRWSGGTFKAMVSRPDAPRIGIDVFAAFHLDGVFNLMGSVRGALPREAIVPLGTVELEGRTMAAPARPEELLALTYGEGWRQPDPAFKYVVPPSTKRRFTAWMRGERVLLSHWNDTYRSAAGADPGSTFARCAAERLAPGSTIVEVGSGAGGDARFLAEAGHRVLCYDYSPVAVAAARKLGRGQRPGSVEARRFNLYDLRQVLAVAALHAHDDDLDAVYARDLLSTLTDDGRRNLWLFSRMVLRTSGRLLVECAVHESDDHDPFRYQRPRAMSPTRLTEEIETLGGTVESCEIVSPGGRSPAVGRLVVRWS